MHLLIVILVYVVAAAIFFGLLYLVIRMAVRHALTDHYEDRGRLDAVATQRSVGGSAHDEARARNAAAVKAAREGTAD